MSTELHASHAKSRARRHKPWLPHLAEPEPIVVSEKPLLYCRHSRLGLPALINADLATSRTRQSNAPGATATSSQSFSDRKEIDTMSNHLSNESQQACTRIVGHCRPQSQTTCSKRPRSHANTVSKPGDGLRQLVVGVSRVNAAAESCSVRQTPAWRGNI